MSHVIKGSLEIRDLAALRAAVLALGGEWLEGQRSYRWYGRLLGGGREADAAIDWGKCHHAITLKGGTAQDYEIGVVAVPGHGYRLDYDAWTPTGLQGCAHGLHRAFGVGLSGLKREYAAQVAERRLRQQGYQTARKTVNGRLVVEGVKA